MIKSFGLTLDPLRPAQNVKQIIYLNKVGQHPLCKWTKTSSKLKNFDIITMNVNRPMQSTDDKKFQNILNRLIKNSDIGHTRTNNGFFKLVEALL